MDVDGLIKQAKRIASGHASGVDAMIAEAKEFLRVYAGSNSSFFSHINQVDRIGRQDDKAKHIRNTLQGFIEYLENGLFEGVSIERKAQLDVISDYLEQATLLLSSSEFHPAAATVLIGASLEEYLRNWVEEEELDIGDKKPSLDSYAKVLREAELISKQDMKDITSWSGLRNHAAHGEWEEVKDRKRIEIMLEGVNLFMRKYTGIKS